MKKTFSSFLELLFSLTLKELKVRYKNTVLGFVWSILNPLLLMTILSFVFLVIFKIGIEKYPAFLLCALLPWAFFSNSVSSSATSIVDNANLIKKLSFTREAIPLSAILANLVHFLLALIVLFVFLVIFKVRLTVFALVLPFIIFIQLLFIIGVSFITSSLHVYYRDVKYIIEAVLLCWFYATPIFYSTTFVPDRLLRFYMLNPMAAIVTAYRDILLYGRLPEVKIIMFGIFWAAISLCFGILFFRKLKGNFADAL